MRRALIGLIALSATGAAAQEVVTLQWEAGVMAIAPADLTRVVADESGTVTVQLEPGLAEDFADLTERLIGDAIAILVCGRELASPEVRARIPSGVIVIPVGARALDVEAVLRGQAPCEGLWET